jgi:hypothetical protein
VKISGPRWSEISPRFRVFCFSLVVLSFISNAFGANGQLALNPSTMSFGTVSVGASQMQSLTLTNSGGSKLTLTQAMLTQTAFTFSGLSYPVTLAGGQSITGHLTLTPQSSGTASAVLSITFSTQNSNGKHNSFGGSNTVTLPVSGVGSVASGQLATTPASLAFGSVQVGNSQTLAETLTNSGGANVTISGATAIGSGFTASVLSSPITLSTGQSVAVSITFAPTSGSSVSGNLAITSNASNSALNVPLSGTGVTPGQLTANPANLGFGSVATGSSSTLAETLTNSGGSALTISQITPSGTGFSFSGISLPLTLSAAQSVTFKASFAPQSAGSVAGSFLISSNGSNPAVSVPSTGTGTLPGELAVAPSTINFGNVMVRTTQNQTSTLSASNAPVIVTSLGVSGSQFSVSGIALPVTIAAGNSVSFQLTFAPKAAGSVSANVTFASNASNSPAVQSLTGSGALLQHSVSLGWNTSTSSNVVGYNIYRETSLGGSATRINSALDATPFDTDSTVQSGQTYYYVVTAVDSAGTESSYSNQVQAVIPYP